MFMQKIRKHISKPDDYIISLNVKNFFTSIDLNEMAEDIDDTIVKNYSASDNHNTKKKLHFYIKGKLFKFNNTIYK